VHGAKQLWRQKEPGFGACLILSGSISTLFFTQQSSKGQWKPSQGSVNIPHCKNQSLLWFGASAGYFKRWDHVHENSKELGSGLKASGSVSRFVPVLVLRGKVLVVRVYRGGFYEKLLEASPVAPPVPKPCHTSPVQYLTRKGSWGWWLGFRSRSKNPVNTQECVNLKSSFKLAAREMSQLPS